MTFRTPADFVISLRSVCANKSRNGWGAVGLFAALAAAVMLLFGSVAFAHSGLGAASPGPGAVVGGEITTIQLRYNGTVTDPDGSVTDPNGEIVDTTFTQNGNLRVTVSLDAPLSAPGQYAVRHITTDVEDNDRIEAAYLFTYDPIAPPPQLEIIAGDGGFVWVWVIVGGGGIVIAVLAWRLATSVQRARGNAPAA
jgi:methionine-rich copper-binding protein CopC